MRKDWEVKKLGEIATYINGYAFKPDQWGNKGIPIIRIQNLNDSNAPYNYCDNVNIPNKYLVSNGDILISWSASLGVYEWLKNDAYLNQHIFKVLFNKLDINKYFFKYAVSSRIDQMVRNAHGATMKHIVKKDFDNTKICYPPIQIQLRIVEELDCLTSIIEKQKKQLEELDNLAQSIFYDMFGDPITNPKGMKMNKVSDLTVKMLTGPFGSMLHKSDYTADGIPSINPQNINKRKIITKDIARVSYQKAEELSKYIVRSNNIIVARRGDLKKCAIVTDKEDGWLCGTGSFMLELNKDIFPILFYYQYTSQSIQKYLNDKCIGATLPNLNQKILGDLKIIVPPFELQQQFAAKIEAIEKQKELIKKSIKETEDLFNGRMDYYFN